MQSNCIYPPVFTEITPENKQLQLTTLSEEIGTEGHGEESRLSTEGLNMLFLRIIVSKWSMRALQSTLCFPSQ